MKDWLEALRVLNKDNEACVLITVAAVLGSTPREIGANMVVTADNIFGTIGGGNLEFKAIELAHEFLQSDVTEKTLQKFPLGPGLGQCCGGVAVLHFETIHASSPNWIEQTLNFIHQNQHCVLVSTVDVANENKNISNKLLVTVTECLGSLDNEQLDKEAIIAARLILADPKKEQASLVKQIKAKVKANSDEPPVLFFEPVFTNDFHIALFGAGHVGKALVKILSELQCKISWVDSRPEQFPDNVPSNVSAILSEHSDEEVKNFSKDTYYLIMTHSHALDQDICEAILIKNDFAYLGLIGSKTKRSRFEKRLRQKGITTEQLTHLTCPIGIDGIYSKLPAAIAVSVSAELLQLYEQRKNSTSNDIKHNIATAS